MIDLNFGSVANTMMNVDIFSQNNEPKPQRAVAKPAMQLENQFLDFEKNKVQTLTLDQLRNTNLENRGDDRSCPHGIYHYELIQRMLDMCEKHGYHAEVYDLFATNNKDKQTPGVSLYPELEKKYGIRSIKATTLRRVYANVRLTDWDDSETTTNLAVSYTQKGIQVGFGTMVKICHNQNMMGYGRFVADYTINNHYANGEEYKTDLDGIFGRVDGWLKGAESAVFRERATIQQMKQRAVNMNEFTMIVGLLNEIRVACDSQNKSIRMNIVYPLNQTQINKFTEDALIQYKKSGNVTVWDLYNIATNLYKPVTCEQNMILPQNLGMYNFLHERCNLC